MREPKMHATRRKLFSHAFSQNSLLLWESLLQERTSLAVDRIKREAMSSGGADVLKWFTFMATDVIAELGFGESFSALENGEVSSPSPKDELQRLSFGIEISILQRSRISDVLLRSEN